MKKIREREREREREISEREREKERKKERKKEREKERKNCRGKSPAQPHLLSSPMPKAMVATTMRSLPAMNLCCTSRRNALSRPAW